MEGSATMFRKGDRRWGEGTEQHHGPGWKIPTFTGSQGQLISNRKKSLF